jgi:hypothetical protein
MRRFMLVALIFVTLACVCPATSGITGTLEAMQGTFAVMLTEAPGMLTDLPLNVGTDVQTHESGLPGTLRGHLIYPAEVLVAQRIVAFDIATMTAVADVTTSEGQNEYELNVPAGDYYVVAYTLDGGLSAGYSQAVPCGLSVDCTDHSLIPVHVNAGETVNDIDPQDWYADAGTFPPMP